MQVLDDRQCHIFRLQDFDLTVDQPRVGWCVTQDRLLLEQLDLTAVDHQFRKSGEARRRREEIDGRERHDQQKGYRNDRILPVQEPGKNLEELFERKVIESGRGCLGATVGKRWSFEGLIHFSNSTAYDC